MYQPFFTSVEERLAVDVQQPGLPVLRRVHKGWLLSWLVVLVILGELSSYTKSANLDLIYDSYRLLFGFS